jgi:hypothetical protein
MRTLINLWLGAYLITSICADVVVVGQKPTTASPGFTPPAGNTLWLVAANVNDPVDGQPVSTWTDSSGSGNHATNFLTARPTYETSIVNGLPVVRFDGSDDYLQSPCTDYGTVFAVISMRTVGSDKSWIGAASSSPGGWDAYLIGTSSDNDTMVSRVGQSGGASALAATGSNPSITAGTFFIWTFKQSGALNIWQYKDGNAQGTFSGANTPQGSLQYTVLGGGVFGGGVVDRWQWDIAEVLVFNSALPAADLNTVGTHLGTKYGITWNTIP